MFEYFLTNQAVRGFLFAAILMLPLLMWGIPQAIADYEDSKKRKTDPVYNKNAAFNLVAACTVAAVALFAWVMA